MWQVKHFKSREAQEEWITANHWFCQITRLFVNNGYAVEYRKLRNTG